MSIEKYFTKEEIVNNLSKYETYYQIALGKLIYLSNITEVSYEVDFKLALGSIYELITDLKDEENLDSIFDKELKKQTSMDAVQNFINDNMELIQSRNFAIEPIINDINDDKFFNEDMKEVFKENVKLHFQKYNDFVTDDLANQIKSAVEELTQK
ncbi:hypothetical protein [Arcobacter sp. LA11]|uniref:hypothetical protein n=1 Tax=Arcobacter sp. LA11 TaxID=1898176 RepID=UPI00093436DE|nr:hypothetical protein [Arcobacter sp. LA11]